MQTFVGARDQICERVDSYLADHSADIVGIIGYRLEMRFPRIVYKQPVDKSKHWGRVSIQSVMSSQAAFVGYNPTEDNAENYKKKKYEESGLIFVQLFAPKAEVEGGEQQDKLAQLVRACFRGKSLPGKVWFRNARINDLDAEDEMLRLNVVAEYEYNEIA